MATKYNNTMLPKYDDLAYVKLCDSLRTPGPWRIGDAGHTVFGPPNGNPSPETIARPIKKQNVPIIAAAPDLLEALIELLSLYRHDTALQNGDNTTTAKAHNAIAKATQLV